MRSLPGRDRADLTTKAVIRDEALRLFAEQGPERVSVRQVAAAAGVSPGSVMHHYGSRSGLRDAVDAHVTSVFDALFAGLDDSDLGGNGASFSELVTTALPADSAVPAYLRRLLTDGGPVGRALFTRWFTAGRELLDEWTEAGLVRTAPGRDRDVLAAFLMVNDLALLILRDHLTDVLRADPLSRAGMARWVEAVMGVYRNGLFVGLPAAAGPVPQGRDSVGPASNGMNSESAPPSRGAGLQAGTRRRSAGARTGAAESRKSRASGKDER